MGSQQPLLMSRVLLELYMTRSGWRAGEPTRRIIESCLARGRSEGLRGKLQNDGTRSYGGSPTPGEVFF